MKQGTLNPSKRYCVNSQSNAHIWADRLLLLARMGKLHLAKKGFFFIYNFSIYIHYPDYAANQLLQKKMDTLWHEIVQYRNSKRQTPNIAICSFFSRKKYFPPSQRMRLTENMDIPIHWQVMLRPISSRNPRPRSGRERVKLLANKTTYQWRWSFKPGVNGQTLTVTSSASCFHSRDCGRKRGVHNIDILDGVKRPSLDEYL